MAARALMPNTKPMVRASVLASFDRLLAERGIDARPLYSKVGLPAPDTIGPEDDLSANAVCYLMYEAARAADDPCLGLAYAEAYPFGGTGIIAYLFMNSPTVGESMRTVARYAVLLRQPIMVQYQEDADGACLWWRWPDSLTAPYTQYGSFALALFVLRLRMVIGPSWTPVSVELQGEPLGGKERVRKIFGPSIQFGSDKNLVRVDRATINRRMPEADPRLKPILQKLGEQMISEVPELDDIAGSVRNVILDALPGRRATLEQTASKLGLTGRTLQARLAAHGPTSFEAVLSATLKSRADDLIKSTDLPLTEIALQLGFSQLSAFTRACQRWFGCAPSTRRKVLKAQLKI